MKKSIMIFSLIGLLFITESCTWINFSSKSRVKTLLGWGEYQENADLPINGYYYTDITNSFGAVTGAVTQKDYGIIIYYKNGIFCAKTCSSRSLKELDNMLEKENFKKQTTEASSDIAYGSYKISHDTIFHYDGSPNISVSKILTKAKLADIGVYSKDINSIRHYTDSVSRFRPLKTKPDSTNELMNDPYLKKQLKKGYEKYMIKRK